MFCPHCNGELSDAHDDGRGGRCGDCRLVVGARRSLEEPTGDALSSGFAANAARREEADPIDEQRAVVALREVAGRMGCNVERMRMVDYDRQRREHPELPSVAQILSTFETWKRARALARRPAPGRLSDVRS